MYVLFPLLEYEQQVQKSCALDMLASDAKLFIRGNLQTFKFEQQNFPSLSLYSVGTIKMRRYYFEVVIL